jgi:hypothetical protein
VDWRVSLAHFFARNREEESHPVRLDLTPVRLLRKTRFFTEHCSTTSSPTVIFQVNRRSGAQYEPDTHHCGSATHDGR